jgi:DNA-binding PadR family transcriptional regulator
MEHCVLGVVWMLQPCTGYAVRKVFLESFSSAYSGSAGAIYPLLSRMLTNEFLSAESVLTGKRKASMHSLTASGEEALVGWLGETPQPEDTVEMDPIRIKLRFLGALPCENRGEVIDQLITQMQRSKATIEEYESNPEVQFADDPFFHEAMRFALHTHDARIAWLQENRASIQQIK